MGVAIPAGVTLWLPRGKDYNHSLTADFLRNFKPQRYFLPRWRFNMWFKLFVLLRLPVSVVALFGFVVVGGLGALFALGACVVMAVVSIELARLRPVALSLAWWLLALETVGAVLLILTANIATIRPELIGAFVILCGVLVVWVLPNVAILYRARALLTEPEKQKPGV
jgi:hypothetical protein